MGTSDTRVNTTEPTTPLQDRIAGRELADPRPRWLRIQQERIAQRERAGGSRWDAVVDLTEAGATL